MTLNERLKPFRLKSGISSDNTPMIALVKKIMLVKHLKIMPERDWASNILKNHKNIYNIRSIHRPFLHSNHLFIKIFNVLLQNYYLQNFTCIKTI